MARLENNTHTQDSFVFSSDENNVLSRVVFLTLLQRTVIVPPEAGYGQKGMNEIPVRTYKLYMRKAPFNVFTNCGLMYTV